MSLAFLEFCWVDLIYRVFDTRRSFEGPTRFAIDVLEALSRRELASGDKAKWRPTIG